MAGLRLITAILTLGVATSSALANMPPKEFDHGPLPAHVTHRVAFGQAAAMCERIYMKRFGEHYPSHPIYGCTIKNRDGSKPEIVYSYDPTGADPKMASNTRGHEEGHLRGWPSNHPNALP